jgi:DNA gyrase subunit A
MGVKNIQVERDAVVIHSRAVSDTDEIFVMTASGVVIRTPVSEIRITGRGTKGVKIMRLDEKDRVVGVAIVTAEMDVAPEAVPETPGSPVPQAPEPPEAPAHPGPETTGE